MRKRWRAALFVPVAALFLLAVNSAFAQNEPVPILSHTFEQDEGGWQGVGPSVVVALTHDPASVKTGKGALQFSYAVKKNQINLLLLPTPDSVLAKAKSVHFWIKTDHSTPIVFTLQEKDGGRYNSLFTVPRDVWQHVELSVADFVLDTNKDAPKDPDGKLDTEQVEGAAIVDMAQMFVQGDEAIARLLGIEPGARTMYLDDFSMGISPVMPGSTLKNGEGLLDTFAHPQVGWLATGDVQLSLANGKPLDSASVQAKYHQAPAKIIGISKFVPMGGMTGAAKLTLSAASQRPAKIVVQVEEKGGGKYNTTIELPGNSTRTEISVNFADFKQAMDSHDDNNRLDLDQVTQVLFIDGTGLLDNVDADNILWIAGVRAVK